MPVKRWMAKVVPSARSFVLVGLGVLLLCPLKVSSQEIVPIHGKPISHQVDKGEFLYKIALQYNCSYPAVSRANGIQNPNEVRLGRK